MALLVTEGCAWLEHFSSNFLRVKGAERCNELEKNKS